MHFQKFVFSVPVVADDASLNSSNVAVTSYAMDVNAFPQSGSLKVKACVGLFSNKKGTTKLDFELGDEFKIETITQSDKPLKFSRDKWKITVDGVQVAQNPPPLVWEYAGTFTPPYKSDSMSDVIVYPAEIRLTYTSHWFPIQMWNSEHPANLSSSLSVEVPVGFTVIASSDSPEKLDVGRDGRIVHKFANSTRGNLSFVAAKYAKTSIPWRDKTIEAYFFPKDPNGRSNMMAKQLPQEEKAVLKALTFTKNILDFYSDKFGSYPWKRLALVQKGSYNAYAYGVRTYVVMNKFSLMFGEKSLAHEIAHQWWGNLVHPVGPGERWLTESLAEYSAFLYMEHAHGEKQVTDDRNFLLSQMQNMSPIRQTSFNTPNFDNIIYHIGPHVFHMLRYVVGDEQFAAILKTFAEKYADKDATVDDFIEVAENIHKEPLGWFFSEWLDKTKNPAFVLDSNSTPQPDGSSLVKGAINQHNTDYRMPLDIEIIGQAQKEKHRIWVQGAATSFEFSVSYKPQEVKFAEDMQFWILADFFGSENERLTASKRRPEPPARKSLDEFIQIIRSKVSVECPYKLGAEIQLKLGDGQAARLNCAANPYKYREILICPLEGNMFTYSFYTDGQFAGGGSSLSSGRVRHTNGPSPDVLEKTAWEMKENKVHIKFCTETDREKIKETYKEDWKKEGKTPEQIEELLKQFLPESDEKK